MSCSRTQYSGAGGARTRNRLNWSRVKHSNIEPLRSHTELCFFLFLGTASRRPNEKHRSPLLVQADQSLRTLTAMVHAGMSDFYYTVLRDGEQDRSPFPCKLFFNISDFWLSAIEKLPNSFFSSISLWGQNVSMNTS